jgi:hypothetical protein
VLIVHDFSFSNISAVCLKFNLTFFFPPPCKVPEYRILLFLANANAITPVYNVINYEFGRALELFGLLVECLSHRFREDFRCLLMLLDPRDVCYSTPAGTN